MPITFQHVSESILPLLVGVVYALINIHNVKLPSLTVLPESTPTIVVLSCVETFFTRRSPTFSFTMARLFVSTILTYCVFKISLLIWIYENLISQYIDGYLLFLLFALLIFCLTDSIPSLKNYFQNKSRSNSADSSDQATDDGNTIIGEVLLNFISLILLCAFIYYFYQFSSFFYSKYLEFKKSADYEYFYESFDD